MKYREMEESDLTAVLDLHQEAFGADEGPVVARLVDDLVHDESAHPLFSFVAEDGEAIVGHVLFSAAQLTGDSIDADVHILAPMAVLPSHQKKGVGTALIKFGLNAMHEEGEDLVFVLGHPEYYPRFGFVPAGERGFEAPYPILPRNAAAWMVLAQDSDLGDFPGGKVRCADALDAPELWAEPEQ